MWLVEFSLAHRIPVARLPCPEIGFFIKSQPNYNRYLEFLL
ncbi:hypothetical protein EVA_09750 [gut metagenome]|uniref:Uncharacterized protein n=1 Tax=gut metagenome TaxID=749906 RepID=J9GQ55_9ZZZZ